VDEVDEASSEVVQQRMASEQYEVMHKASGHLFILSTFIDPEDDNDQLLVMHTKGSLENQFNDLLRDDIRVFGALYADKVDQLVNTFPNSTWMFEAIVQHDKHSMYEHDSKRYGENAFVLLGGYIKHNDTWDEVDISTLKILADCIGCPVIETYSVGRDLTDDFSLWYDDTETEGYVIWFTSDGHRVKIKTKDYWANRFKKDLTAENILSTFKSSGDTKFETKLPEEMCHQIIEVLDEKFRAWWHDEYIDTEKIFGELLDVVDKPLTKEARAVLFKERTDLTMGQKQYIALTSDGKRTDEIIWSSKDLRKHFYEYMMYDLHSERLSNLQEKLSRIVDELG
jgi:hypothetical protein